MLGRNFYFDSVSVVERWTTFRSISPQRGTARTVHPAMGVDHQGSALFQKPHPFLGRSHQMHIYPRCFTGGMDMEHPKGRPMVVHATGGRNMSALGSDVRLKISSSDSGGDLYVFEALTPPGFSAEATQF